MPTKKSTTSFRNSRKRVCPIVEGTILAHTEANVIGDAGAGDLAVGTDAEGTEGMVVEDMIGEDGSGGVEGIHS
jgi:hypothetical protein